jgi:DNA-binding transcriptional LysR family regulator
MKDARPPDPVTPVAPSPSSVRIETLQVFCDAVRYHSFSRSAEDNRLSQPGVSWSIRQLESNLGATLIDRSRRPWTLTPEGTLVFRGGVDILAHYRRLVETIRHVRVKPDAELRVASIYSVGPASLGRHLERFSNVQPGTHVRLEYHRPDRVLRLVLEGRADLGIISFPPTHRDLAVTPWREEPMVVACLPGHRLARRRSAPPSELKDEPFVGFERGLEIRRRIDRFLARHRVDVKVTMEFDNVESIKRAVEAGAGISILPRPTLERELKMGSLRAVPFDGASPSRALGLVHRRSDRNASLTQFISILLNEGGVDRRMAL